MVCSFSIRRNRTRSSDDGYQLPDAPPPPLRPPPPLKLELCEEEDDEELLEGELHLLLLGDEDLHLSLELLLEPPDVNVTPFGNAFLYSR